MSDLLARIKAKKAAAAQAESASTEQEAPKEEPVAKVATDSQLAQRPMQTMTEAEYEAAKSKGVVPESEVIMGITVEDLQERIAHAFEHAKTAEKHDIKEDMDDLKRAIHANPSIVQHLLPEDIGRMVGVLRKIHSDARVEAAQTPARKRATKSAEAKAAKELLKKPLSKEDLDSLMDEL